MAYLDFDKSYLLDYPKALDLEYILVNKKGAYSSSTCINCHSRKYHGLLVIPQEKIDDSLHLMLSALDESIFKNGNEFPFSVHQYPNTVYPNGYLFLEKFTYEIVAEWLYKLEDIHIKKSILLHKENAQLFISYELLEANEAFIMKFRPFLAFRNIHKLSHSSAPINRKFEEVDNGVRFQLYDRYDPLFMQFSKKVKFVPIPDWNYKLEYSRERERGYEYQEDLYVPGYFEITMKKGEQLIFSASTSEKKAKGLKKMYNGLLSKETGCSNFEDCMHRVADQFIIQLNSKTKIIAGWHWFGAWGRDTFISLPGLLLSRGKIESAREVIDSSLLNLKEGLFPNTGSAEENDYNSVDAPLWFFYCIQQLIHYGEDSAELWGSYGKQMKSILEYYKRGTRHQISMHKTGLITQGEKNRALTWMDAIVDNEGVTPRIGMPVEINALWYNAICLSLEMAATANDFSFINEWEDLPEKIESSFNTLFWNAEKGYLADVVNEEGADWSLRPNQIIALYLPYCMLTEEIKISVIEKVKDKLLTPRGLRTLSPDDINYKGHYAGDQRERDLSYHQGTVWPWLMGPFTEAYLNLYKERGIAFIESVYQEFESCIYEHGIGTISEIYEGEQPHKAVGAISQAWSVAALIRMKELLEKMKTQIAIENQINAELR